MKRVLFLMALFLAAVPIQADGNQQAIHLDPKKVGHQMFPIPADMPDVYYDSSSQEIIVDGNGYANYYDVNIVSVATGLSVIFDTVSGYYGTVDVSSLPSDDYEITITSSNNNVFEGSFYKQ